MQEEVTQKTIALYVKVGKAKTMTDEEAAAFLRLALTSEEARGYLKKRTEGGKSE